MWLRGGGFLWRVVGCSFVGAVVVGCVGGVTTLGVVGEGVCVPACVSLQCVWGL